MKSGMISSSSKRRMDRRTGNREHLLRDLESL